MRRTCSERQRVVTCGGQSKAVTAGTLIYVERMEEHRFCDIVEDLTLLVFFAPPEGSLNQGAAK